MAAVIVAAPFHRLQRVRRGARYGRPIPPALSGICRSESSTTLCLHRSTLTRSSVWRRCVAGRRALRLLNRVNEWLQKMAGSNSAAGDNGASPGKRTHWPGPISNGEKSKPREQ
jgi:hypothetical protein